MKMADRIQQTMKIDQSCHKSSLPQNLLPMKRNLFPTAVAKSHPPCINPWKRGGATFDTKESPIGLKNNSAMVSIK